MDSAPVFPKNELVRFVPFRAGGKCRCKPRSLPEKKEREGQREGVLVCLFLMDAPLPDLLLLLSLLGFFSTILTSPSGASSRAPIPFALVR